MKTLLSTSLVILRVLMCIVFALMAELARAETLTLQTPWACGVARFCNYVPVSDGTTASLAVPTGLNVVSLTIDGVHYASFTGGSDTITGLLLTEILGSNPDGSTNWGTRWVILNATFLRGARRCSGGHPVCLYPYTLQTATIEQP